ncbi:hypothetical protein ALTERO38_60433 [Alteromonas sp. 38]|nr:hypothetical protein ALTERO38_60433 [Alteromonas sp. 38]
MGLSLKNSLSADKKSIKRNDDEQTRFSKAFWRSNTRTACPPGHDVYCDFRWCW